MTIQRWSVGHEMQDFEDDEGPYVEVDDIVKVIREALESEEVTMSDGERVSLCDDWCVTRLGNYLLDQLGASDDDDTP